MMVSEAQEEAIRREALEILDKFAKSLDKVKVSDTREHVNGAGTRNEEEGLKGNEDFRERMFANAPNKSKDCIVAEKGAWT
ncbi:MAG: hypothetical protein AABY02_00525 [Nanoarchaeota archaeon]